jgi:hypothetical protein
MHHIMSATQFAFSFMPNADLKPAELRSMISRIGKCHACKQVSRRDYTASQEQRVGHGVFARTATIFGREVNGRFVRAGADFCCPRCKQHAWEGRTLEGQHNAKVRCDARCMGAKGHQCECACGGANHGAGFICD